MSLLPIKEFISLDHTLKVASNVWFVRSDGKWVTLYKSVFIALNEHGQVVAWQFTKTTSLDEVKQQLQNLQDCMAQSCLPFCKIFCWWLLFSEKETARRFWRCCCQTWHFSRCSTYCKKNTKTPPFLFRVPEWFQNGLSLPNRYCQAKKAV